MSIVSDILQRHLHKNQVRYWNALNDQSEDVDRSKLQTLELRARQLRSKLNRFLHTSETRLSMPRTGSHSIRKPSLSDWSHRPEPWRSRIAPSGIAPLTNRSAFGSETTLFHDCELSEITLRQIRTTNETDLSPFGLHLDVFSFKGSFLSIAINLPTSVTTGLHSNHVIRLALDIETSGPVDISARFNIKHGPNTAQLLCHLPEAQGERIAEFDLSQLNLNTKRLENAWVDVIFAKPEMRALRLRDLTLSRRPRAEF